MVGRLINRGCDGDSLTDIAGCEAFGGFEALGGFVGALFAGSDFEGEDAIAIDFHSCAP